LAALFGSAARYIWRFIGEPVCALFRRRLSGAGTSINAARQRQAWLAQAPLAGACTVKIGAWQRVGVAAARFGFTALLRAASTTLGK